MSISLPPPKRGEIWLVNFDPTVGAEIKKTRPAVVISSDAVGRLPVKLVALPSQIGKTITLQTSGTCELTPTALMASRKYLLLMLYNYVEWIGSDLSASWGKFRQLNWKRLF